MSKLKAPKYIWLACSKDTLRFDYACPLGNDFLSNIVDVNDYTSDYDCYRYNTETGELKKVRW